MKRYFLLLFFPVLAFSASGQQISLIEKSSGMPVGYASISINDKMIGVADSIGNFSLKGTGIKKGDRIGVSSLGMRDVEIRHRFEGETGLTLIELYPTIELPQFRIKGRRSKAQLIFDKTIERRLNMDWYLQHSGDYSITLEGKGLQTGKFTSAILPKSYLIEHNEEIADLTLTPSGEINIETYGEICTAIKAALRNAVLSASTPLKEVVVKDTLGRLNYTGEMSMRTTTLNGKSKPGVAVKPISDHGGFYYNPITIKMAVREATEAKKTVVEATEGTRFAILPDSPHKMVKVKDFIYDEGMNVEYRGLSEGKHIFIITRPYFENNPSYLQHHETTMIVDDKSMEVTEAVVTWIDEKIGMVLKVHAVYAVNKDPSLYAYRYPTRVKGKMFMQTGAGEEEYINLDVELSNIKISDFGPRRDAWGVPYSLPLHYQDMEMALY